MLGTGNVSFYVSYKYVTYYTIKIDDKEQTLFDDFLTRMTLLGTNDKKVLKELTALRIWIKNVGESKFGIPLKSIKFEHDCHALPDRTVKGLGIRLYCYWINERIVILFNGDNKIKDDARYCPNVKSHFYCAQSLAKQIKRMEIKIEGNKIIKPEELIVNI